MLFNLIVTQDGQVVATTIDTVLVATLVSLFIPLVVNFLTKQTASDGLRAVINIVGVAVVSVLALWINPSGASITWQLCVNTFLSSLVVSFAAYKGVWKPTGVAGSITASTPNFGLGSPPTVQTESKGAEERGQVDNEPGA